MLADPTTHDLSHSSEPTGSVPIFLPIATAAAKTADEALEILAEECNALADQEEAMHTARGVFDTRSAEYEAAGKAIDPITDLLHFKWTMAKLVRPETHLGLAAKARIYHSMRHALAGCVVEQAYPLMASIVEDVARLGGQRPRELWASADAALIRDVNEAVRLSAENDAIWNLGPELADNDPRQAEWGDKAQEATNRYHTCISNLAATKPLTPAGLAAKASMADHLTMFRDETRETPEAALMFSITKDAVRLGASMPAENGDTALLSLGRYFEAQWLQERKVIARGGTDAEIKTEEARTEILATRIRDLPATTPAGWHVKARTIVWAYQDGYSDARIGIVDSLLRDLGAIDGQKATAPTLPDPDRYLLALKAPFYAAWMARREADALYEDESTKAAAEAANEAAANVVQDLTRQIESFPATSFEGVKLKVAALSSLYPDEEITSEELTGRTGVTATSIRLVVQILRDLRAMVDEPRVAVALSAPMSLAEFAIVDFEPWTADEAMPLDVEQWSEHLGPVGEHATNVRLACSMLVKTKPQLVNAMRCMEADTPNSLESVHQAFTDTANLFGALKAYAETAATRLLNVGAVLVQEEEAAEQVASVGQQAA